MHGYRGKKYAGGIKRKRRWKNTEYKHRIQRHDAHRHCTLPVKRRCARISNMEITKMKGGRIAKYRYRESMNEKAPEVAERSSKRKCLRMGRSSKKVARRPGSEKMWTSSGGSRTCNHKGSNFCTVAAALVQTVARSGREEPQASGGRAASP